MTKFDWESPDAKNPDVSGGLASERVNLSFFLTKDQAKIINDALIRVAVGLNIVGEYRISRALELICADSLNSPLESYQ